MSKIGDIIGFTRCNLDGYEYTVTERMSGYIVKIKWFCGQEVEAHYSNVLSGEIKYYNHRSKFGVGYLGYGKYKHRRTKLKEGEKPFDKRAVNMWESMLERGFCENFKNKFPTYKNISVGDEWLNLQNFCQWVETQKEYLLRDFNGERYQIDKDILIPLNKVYSPEACCFVPREINSFFRDSFSKVREKGFGVVERVYVKKTLYRSSCKNPITKKSILSEQRITPEAAEQDYIKNKEGIARLLAERWEGLVRGDVIERLKGFKFGDYFIKEIH